MTSAGPAAGKVEQEEVAQLLLPPDLAPDEVQPDRGGRPLTLRGDTMGTRWSLAAVVPEGVQHAAVSQALEKSFSAVISQMSQWAPGSEINRYAEAPAGSWFSLSPQFAHVLDCALQVARASDGAFDPTLGHASELWGFGAGPAPAHVPTDQAAAATRARNWRDLELAESGRLLLQPGGLALDLSGIAKGFAVDLGIGMLQSIGIRHALLDIGGELRGIGVQQDGLPWWVDLEIPPGSTAPTTRTGLCGWAVATSGCYRRQRQADGRVWSHSLDPQSGRPIDDAVLSASVLHRGCMQADALATAIIVLGAEEGIRFADAHAVPARIVTQDRVVTSTAWGAWLS